MRAAVGLQHVWSAGTSGQLLQEGWSSAGVHKPEGLGNSWSILALVQLSRCSSPRGQTDPSSCWVQTRRFRRNQ